VTTITSPSIVPTGSWVIDPAHSQVGFAVKHMGIATVRGEFTEFDGTLEVGEDVSSAKIRGTVKAESVDTNEPQRDAHLRSGDFFENEAYPDITFVSTKVERDGDEWAVTGDLTIKGVSKPVTIVFEQTGSATDPFGNTRVGFEGSATINRKDWGLSWNAALETGGMLVSDKIKLEFDISAIKSA
jgi:polyisoprenoid-binding protein YceI